MQRQFDEPLLCLITSRTALLRVSSNPSPSMSSKDAKSSKWTSAFEQNAPPLPNARTCVEINQWAGALGRAVRNRHRHAIEQTSRRWRGERRDDPHRSNPKYRRLRKANAIIAAKVVKVKGAPEVLACMGFEDAGDEWVIRDDDVWQRAAATAAALKM